MYPSYATLWALKKYGINTVHDSTVRIINLAPKGGTPTNTTGSCSTSWGSSQDHRHSGFSDLVEELKDGMTEGRAAWAFPLRPAMETEAPTRSTLAFSTTTEQDLAELPSCSKARSPRAASSA
jgi:hypothetical protein